MPKYTGNPDELTGTLALAYAPHVVSGHVIQKATEGFGDNAQTTVVVWLGEGPWNRIVGAYWGGGLIAPENYHFHPGYLSTSMDEAVLAVNPATGILEYNQGVDPWNAGGQTYSGTAYVIIKLPVGITSEDDMSSLKFVCECLRVGDYDNLGRQLDKDGNVVGQANEEPKPEWFFYSTNAALCMADLLLVRRNLSKSRINWQKWYEWKQVCGENITWVGGSVPDRPVYMNVSSTGILTSNGGFAKVSGGHAWNCGATTISIFPDNTVSFFEFDAGAGTWSGGVTLSTAITNSTQLYLGVQGNVANAGDESGILSINILGTNYAYSNWVAGDRFRIGAEADGTLYIAQNGIKLNFSNVGATPPFVSGLHGAFALFHEGADIIRATMSPINVGGPGTAERTRQRFECGLAFTAQTDIAAAIEAILYISCSEMQDGEQLIFLPPSTANNPKISIFDFNESNILPDSFKTYRLSRDQKPTKLTGVFRDADSAVLKEATVYASRDALVDLLGRENPGGEVYLGTITRGQAECVMNFYMRRQSDLDIYCIFSASGSSWKVLPGDIVTVSKDETNWNQVKFEVIESIDESSVDTPDTRTFVCQLFNEALYSDSDQTPLSSTITDLTTNIIDKPKTPTGFTAQFLLNAVRYQWDRPSDFNIIREYEVWSSPDTSDVSNLLWHGLANGWTELFTAGAPNSITRYLRAVSQIGQLSDFRELTQNIDIVIAPSNYTLVYDGSTLHHSWSPSNPATGIIRYEVSTNENFTDIIFSGLDTSFDETVTGPSAVTRYLRAVGILEKPSEVIEATTTVNSPNPPTLGTNTYNGFDIVWSWQPSTSSPVAYYEITNSTGTVVLDRVPFTTWTEPQIRGVATYSRRVYTVLTSGLRSQGFLTLGYTIPAPNPISGLQVTFDANTGLIRWSWTASTSTDIDSIVLSDNANALPALVANKSATSISESPTEGVTTLRRNVTVVSTNGQSSSSVFTTFTAPTPTAPTISLNRQYPSIADVTVTGTIAPRAVKNTIVKVSTATGVGFTSGVIQTLPEAGKQERVSVFGRASQNTTLYAKVFYKDVWGQNSSDSNELALVFTPFIGSDLSNNTITSLQLLLNNFDNIADNPGFEIGEGETISAVSHTSNGWVFDPHCYLYNNAGSPVFHSGGASALRHGGTNGGSNGLKVVRNVIQADCKPNDQFYIEGFVNPRSSAVAGDTLGVRIVWFDKDFNQLTPSDFTLDAGALVANSWNLIGGAGTAPANAVFASPAFVSTINNGSLLFAFDNIYFRRMVTSTIIGVAAIGSAHIGTAVINDLHVNNVGANKIVAAVGDVGLLFAEEVIGRDYVPAPIGIATQLNGSLSDSATTATVDSTTGFNSIGAFKVDKEIIYYSGKTATTLTGLTRGREDTIAASHADDAVVTARGKGWRLNPERATTNSSVVEINSKASFQGIPFDEIGARAVRSIDDNGFLRGPDRDVVPTSAVASSFIQDAVPDSVNNRMHVTLECGVDEQFNPLYAGIVNGASIDHAKVEILNKFGKQVGYKKYGPFNGKGTIWSGTYIRKYADAWDEATFRVQIHNSFGYSDYIYITAAGGTTVEPTYLAKQSCPIELTIVPSTPDTVIANWIPAISAAGTQKLKVRTRSTDVEGETDVNSPRPWNAWVDAVTGISSGAGTTTWSGASPFTEYEFQIENSGSTGATSNIAYTRTPPQSATISRPAPSNVVGTATGTTTISWSWVRNATDNTNVEYRITDNGSVGAWTSLGSATQTTLNSTGLTALHSYVLEVRNVWSSGTTNSNATASGTVVTPASVPSTNDPSNLNASSTGPNSLAAFWTNNGSVNQTFEYKRRVDVGWTVLSLGAVNSHSLGGLQSSTLYDIRVKATGGTNYVIDSIFTDRDEPEDRFCVVLDSLITLEYGLVDEARNITTDDIIITGKNNKSEIADIEIEKTGMIYYIVNEDGDKLGCSASHPFITNMEETNRLSASEISQKIAKGEPVFVKMNKKERQYMSKVINYHIFLGPEENVWIPKLTHPDHTFIANGFVSHNVKPAY
jgi:hypothetical protein